MCVSPAGSTGNRSATVEAAKRAATASSAVVECGVAAYETNAAATTANPARHTGKTTAASFVGIRADALTTFRLPGVTDWLERRGPRD